MSSYPIIVFHEHSSLIPQSMGVCAICMSESLRIDPESTRIALQDPGLLYPLIEAVEAESRCGQFLLEYGELKSGVSESFASDTLRILRLLQERCGARTTAHVTYSQTRAWLCRIWAQIPNSIPPHLARDDKLIRLCFRWLESSPPGSGLDRQHLIRLIKNTRKASSAIEFNLKLIGMLIDGVIRCAQSPVSDEGRTYENLQLVIPLLDHESIPICLYALLEKTPIDEILSLWSTLVTWTPLAPSREPGIHFSKMQFEGSVFPLFDFLNIFHRVSLKLGSKSTATATPSFVPDWRVLAETMLRMVLAKLADERLIPDTCELLVYLLRLELHGRQLPSLLLAGDARDMLPVVETILTFSETIFNRLTHATNRVRTLAAVDPLQFLNVLIRILQEDLLSLQRGGVRMGGSSLASSVGLSLPTGSLEVARLQAIGASPVATSHRLATSVLPPDAALLLQPIRPVQSAFQTGQVLVAPILASGDTFPTGQGVEVPFRMEGFAGIQNFNNTCYLSSFLQTLFLTDGFCSSVYGFSLQKLGKTEEADFAQGVKLLAGFNLLFARLLKTHHKYIEISEFIRALPPTYRSGEQQDVTESGRWLFDKMGGTDQSLVKSVFGGEMIHKTKCMGCNQVTERKEVFTDLCVSVPKQAEVLGKKRVTVQSLIKRMLKPESLSGDNQYSCDTCGRKQDASRWIELTQLPSHLMLVMHKFSFDVATCDFKKEATVVHPEDGTIDFVGSRYELYASILHYGESAMKGHYVALGKRSGLTNDRQQKWALMDDSNVTMIPEGEAMELLSGLTKPSNSAYVMFFRSTNAPRAVNPRIPQQTIDEALAIESAAVHL